jgi:hypothetical protein
VARSFTRAPHEPLLATGDELKGPFAEYSEYRRATRLPARASAPLDPIALIDALFASDSWDHV